MMKLNNKNKAKYRSGIRKIYLFAFSPNNTWSCDDIKIQFKRFACFRNCWELMTLSDNWKLIVTPWVQNNPYFMMADEFKEKHGSIIGMSKTTLKGRMYSTLKTTKRTRANRVGVHVWDGFIVQKSNYFQYDNVISSHVMFWTVALWTPFQD